MDEFPFVIIVLILSIVSSVLKKKNQQAKKAQKQVVVSPQKKNSAPVQEVPKVSEVPAMSAWTDDHKPQRDPLSAWQETVPAAPIMGTEGADTCHDYMLPKQGRISAKRKPAAPVMGTEGEDACHDYMLEDSPITLKEAQEDQGLSQEEAQDLVRGIILSEIMARPHQRFAGRTR